MSSRPDFEPVKDVNFLDDVDPSDAAFDFGVTAPRTSYTLITSDSHHPPAVGASTPLPLRPTPSPRATPVNRYWFNPPWIEENAGPDIDHGEFESPVWLAVELTLRAERERAGSKGPGAQHAAETLDQSGGQLRSLLKCIAMSKRVAGVSHREPTSLLERRLAQMRPSPLSRYHELPAPAASQARKIARFLASSWRRVSVNQN